MSKYLVAVDSGHGMSTPGKRTPKLTKNLYIDGKLVKKKGDIIHEKEFNKASAEYLINALERCGFNTINVSPGTNDVSLQDRVRKANNAGADFYISKHYNAIGSCSKFQDNVKGIVSIYNYGSNRSEKAAKLIQSELIKEHGGFNFNARSDKDISGFSLYVLSHTKMAAALTESGFMDYQPEAERMLDPKFQKADAEATCRGICKYFDVKYIEEKVTTNTSKFKIKVLSNTLNVRKVADWNADPVTKVKKGQWLEVVAEVDAKHGKTNMYKLESGLYITASKKYVEVYK